MQLLESKRWTYLIGTSNHLGKLVLLLALALDHGLDDAGVVRAEVDEAVRHTRLPQCLEKGKRRRVHVGVGEVGGGTVGGCAGGAGLIGSREGLRW